MKLQNQTQEWVNDKMFNNLPLLIAGPCSAESEKQMLDIAHSLDKTRVNVFRAGVWKPRTKLGTFEGVGEIGLKWLKKVKEETGLLVSTEIANSEHVKLALKYDIDILWIGARTTVNPFMIQEIADTLKGIDKIVLVKNPVNPDLEFWIGALERLYKAGVKKLGAIHRGFSTYKKLKYRNIPKWQIPIALKDRFPHIPIICDPSHICGNREGIYDVSQKSFDLKFNGLMVETHTTPDEAWSDAQQQITPDKLKEIVKQLTIRKEDEKSSLYQDKLNEYRTEIDEVDEQLFDLFADRMKISKKIGMLKAENNVAVLQNAHWRNKLDKILNNSKKIGLREKFIQIIFNAIHDESITVQTEITK